MLGSIWIISVLERLGEHIWEVDPSSKQVSLSLHLNWLNFHPLAQQTQKVWHFASMKQEKFVIKVTLEFLIVLLSSQFYYSYYFWASLVGCRVGHILADQLELRLLWVQVDHLCTSSQQTILQRIVLFFLPMSSQQDLARHLNIDQILEHLAFPSKHVESADRWHHLVPELFMRDGFVETTT